MIHFKEQLMVDNEEITPYNMDDKQFFRKQQEVWEDPFMIRDSKRWQMRIEPSNDLNKYLQEMKKNGL